MNFVLTLTGLGNVVGILHAHKGVHFEAESRRPIEPRRGGRASRDDARAFFALVARAFLVAMASGFRLRAG